MGQPSKEEGNTNNLTSATKIELNTHLEKRGEGVPKIGFLHFFQGVLHFGYFD